MSYRLPEHRMHLSDVSDDGIISVNNGTITRVSIPCVYLYQDCYDTHDRMLHDHFGWPSPDNPDWSCQLPSWKHAAIIKVDRIDLAEEGYTSIIVSLLDPPTGLSVTGSIKDNMVNLSITTMCDSVTKEDAEIPFVVFATGVGYDTDGTQVQLRDIVVKGLLHIIANPIR